MAEMNQYAAMGNAELVERLCYAADDGAMYYLLFVRLQEKLTDELYRYGVGGEDANYDTLMDFFFYLRDGERGDNPMPYASLMLIRDAERLDGWIWRCFRYFLAARYKRLKQTVAWEEVPVMADADSAHIFTSEELDVVIRLLELVNRSFSAPERYVFFSDMYAMKTGRGRMAEELSATLGCSLGNLRVMRHRIKMKIRSLLKSGV